MSKRESELKGKQDIRTGTSARSSSAASPARRSLRSDEPVDRDAQTPKTQTKRRARKRSERELRQLEGEPRRRTESSTTRVKANYNNAL